MKKLAPSLIIGLIGGLLILAMFFVPAIGWREGRGQVVTADIKALEASLSLLRRHLDSGNRVGVETELASLERAWVGLGEGLAVRGLKADSDVRAFEQGIVGMRAAQQDKRATAEAFSALRASFALVKADLQRTIVWDIGRFSLTLGVLLLIWFSLVLAIPALSTRLSLKQ